MAVKVTREALYSQVWERPMKWWAAQYDVSPTLISELCRRYAIPTPRSGHWTRRELGKPFDQPPLGPAPEGLDGPVVIEAKPVRVRESVRPKIARADPAAVSAPTLAPEPMPEAEPEIGPDALGDHPRVAKTRARLARASAASGLVQAGSKGLFRVSVTPEVADRAVNVLNQLVRAVEACGWSVESGEGSCRLSPDGEPVRLEISEQTDRVRHIPTEKELEAVRRFDEKRRAAQRAGRYFSEWDAPKVPEWDDVPNGLLVLRLEYDRRHANVRRTFSDGKRQRLEQLIGDVVQSLANFAAGEKRWRAEMERRRLEAIEDEKLRREAERRRGLEIKRVEFLQAQMKRFEDASRIEIFLAAYRDNAANLSGPMDSFVAWATDYLARLRGAISPDALNGRLNRLDLMNDDLTVYSWQSVD